MLTQDRGIQVTQGHARAVSESVAAGPLERVRFEPGDALAGGGLAPTRTVCLPSVALLLGNPSVELAFIPQSLWHGTRLVRTIEPWPRPRVISPAELRRGFRAAVRRCAGDEDTVAVQFSGGLDSLAVLHHADELCRAEHRRLVAIVVDMVAERGASAAAAARAAITDLAIDCELLSIDERFDGPDPDWSPAGPRFDAMPAVNRRSSELAAEHGAGALLTGSGADELLMCARFTTLALARARQLRAARRALRDMAAYDGAKGVAGELAGLGSAHLSRTASFSALYAFLWAEADDPLPGGLVGPRFAEGVRAHHRAWIEAQRALLERNRHDWCAVAATAAIYPRDFIPDPTELPVRSPFTDPGFVELAQRLPPAARYDEARDCAYHRLKGPVLWLLPEGRRLPTAKQTFAGALAAQAERGLTTPPRRCLELGLVGENWRQAVAADGRLGLTLAAVERWCDQALRQGASFSADPL